MTAAVTRQASRTAARFVRVAGLGPRATAVSLAITTRLVVANAVAALFVVTYLTLTDDFEGRRSTWPWVVVSNAVTYVVAVVGFSVASIVRGKRLFATTWRWLDEDRAPSEAERADLMGQPMRIGMFPLRYWALAAALTVVANLATGEDAGRALFVAFTTIEGGFVAALLGWLLSDRELRPVFAEALAGHAPPERSSLGVGKRLVLAWALGAGVPLVGIIFTPLVTTDAVLDPAWPMAFLAAVGIVAGLTTTAVTAKSIVHPLGQVRHALRQVEAGDLETAVVVDDPGELGQLQAGVNEMVAGLRQRAELEDLFGRHVGAPVVRHALEHGAQLGGEVRCVSAVFADLRASTEISRRLPPQEVVTLLNRFFAAVVEACDAEDGWVDDFQGDGALCVFGALVDQPDHATRALRTSRAIAATVAALRPSYPDLDAGIGVASGEVVAGHVGTETRLEFTVIGPPVNTAARLTVAAKLRPGRVLADRNVIAAAATEERARWQPGEPVDLQGLEPRLTVFEPVLA